MKYLIYIFANIADLVLTLFLSNKYGNEIEANPIAFKILEYGDFYLCVHKLICVSIFIAAVYFMSKKRKLLGNVVCYTGIAIMTSVVVYTLINMFVL